MFPTPLVSAAWLKAHLRDPDLRILDCRFVLSDPGVGEAAYAAGHLPGAVYLHLERDLSGPKTPTGAGGRHPLPDPAVLAARLGALGIGDGHRIVAYDDPRGGHGMYAARAWWLLRWLGHDAVSVLDGGLAAWDGGLTAEVPALAPATFTARPRPELLASVDEVAALSAGRAAGATLVDSRAAARFRGETEPIDRKAGHIPGARNVDWAGALDASGRFRPAADQAARFGLRDDEDAVLYCGSGVSADVNLLSLAVAGRDLGPRTRLYAGSWSDWVSDDARPVETGEARDPNAS